MTASAPPKYWGFYWPLALTGLVTLLAQQLQNAALARYPDFVPWPVAGDDDEEQVEGRGRLPNHKDCKPARKGIRYRLWCCRARDTRSGRRSEK